MRKRSQQIRSQRKSMVVIALMIFLSVLTAAADFQFNWFERLMGAYLESQNDKRPRLAKFVEQETRNTQAILKVQSLLTQKTEEPAKKASEKKPKMDSARMLMLDKGQKLVMTREYFLATHARLDQTGQGIPQVELAPQMAWQEEWTRTILVRAGWLQAGALYFVDDGNHILSKTPLSADQFDLIYAYGSSPSDASSSEKEHRRKYTPQRFFAMLRGLPLSVREQIISQDRFLDLESTARRVGISEVVDGMAEIVFETLVDNRIHFTSIRISEGLFQEINVALGEADSQADTLLRGEPD